jgi:hypothetical protein
MQDLGDPSLRDLLIGIAPVDEHDNGLQLKALDPKPSYIFVPSFEIRMLDHLSPPFMVSTSLPTPHTPYIYNSCIYNSGVVYFACSNLGASLAAVDHVLVPIVDRFLDPLIMGHRLRLLSVVAEEGADEDSKGQRDYFHFFISPYLLVVVLGLTASKRSRSSSFRIVASQIEKK